MSYPIAKYQRHLEQWLNQATPIELQSGLCWYPAASGQCLCLAVEHGITIKQACGIVAVLSPAMRWERNIRAARNLLTGKPCEAYKANVAKGLAIKHGTRTPEQCCTGPKVRAFYNLLCTGGKCYDLCLDSIAILAALGKDPGRVINDDARAIFHRPKQLTAIDTAYRRVALKRNLRPSEVQAIVWTVWRNERDND